MKRILKKNDINNLIFFDRRQAAHLFTLSSCRQQPQFRKNEQFKAAI